MMSSKPPRKMMKSMRSSPIRKERMMKKSGRSSPPMRSSGSSRPPPGKHLPPGMKRGHLGQTSSKSMQAPRIHSIASSPHRSAPRHSMPSSPESVDRSRSYKRNKFEKRKLSSISPVRHPSPPPISQDRRVSSPYHEERFLNSRSVDPEDRLASPPTKKKMRREPERYPRSPSPNLMRKSTEIPFISDGGPSLRSEIIAHPTSMPMMSRSYMSPHNERMERNYRSQHSLSPVPTNQSKKQPPVKTAYDSGGVDRYKSDISSAVFPSGEKPYQPTLNERFSSVVTVRTEPRIRYSREDLEKITIDIRRNLKEHSPTLRQIVNPNEVKLVRRAGEGHRPIFDREEIKQAPTDMREDAYFEVKTSSNEKPYHSSHSMSSRDIENYEITRHRFDGHNPPFHTSSNRSLSERWQGPDGRKESASLDRDERDREYERVPIKKNYLDLPRNRSKSGDRDFRSERFSGGETSRGRHDYNVNHSRIVPSSEPRSQIIRHKELHPEVRRRHTSKGGSERLLSPPSHSESRSSLLYPVSEKRYTDNLSREKHLMRRSPGLEPPKHRPRSRSRGRDDKISEFSRRPDKYTYKSWPDKREMSSSSSPFSPRGRDYSESYRGRSSSRPFRSSRGFRGRGFRGSSRGGLRGRGSFTRGSTRGFKNSISPRGRGATRRGRYSPHLWEHDLYARLSPDRK